MSGECDVLSGIVGCVSQYLKEYLDVAPVQGCFVCRTQASEPGDIGLIGLTRLRFFWCHQRILLLRSKVARWCRAVSVALLCARPCMRHAGPHCQALQLKSRLRRPYIRYGYGTWRWWQLGPFRTDDADVRAQELQIH
ncbi:hypothetical protein CH282_01715 [Rhodococcus sp. 06-418-1B]|nr:hypothetical protein CH282_01715 [Rhodococcus sp. 06-418-1B]